MAALFLTGVGIAAMQPAMAQDPLPGEQLPSLPAIDRTLATLHGVVRNSATGEGVPRALVSIQGDASTGALTDGDGRFEIPGLPVGPQAVEVRKPGFLDQTNSAVYDATASGLPHNVLLAADMADVEFTLSPTCTIRGQIELSTGDPAEGIEVGLARRTVANGRAIWQASGFAHTRSDGKYRFGGLADGAYALYTEPSMDSEAAANLVQPGAKAAERWGYASVYYPDARDPSGAAKITVASGEEAQANLTLTREPFQTVTANVVPAQAGMNYSALVMDGAGRQLRYGAQYDQNSHTIQAALPDGSYSMLVSSAPQFDQAGRGGGAGVLVGTVDFSVAGHAVTNLRVPLTTPRPSSVQVNVVRSGAGKGAGQIGEVLVMVNRAGGWIDDGMASVYASGTPPAPLPATYTLPGAYWADVQLAEQGLCEGSFTAGGANLAREPVAIGLSGSTAPMELTLRDDCAQLNLSLPEDVAGMAAGEERYYTAWVVPDFDFTRELYPVVLRPTSGGTVLLNNMTPGNYHVYTFAGPVRLEYRNRTALAALPDAGQAVTLSPSETTNLVVEAPEP
jgi:hypothetical protein